MPTIVSSQLVEEADHKVLGENGRLAGSKDVKTLKTLLAPEAFHGWLGRWVRGLERFIEADPVALLGFGLGALAHCVRHAVRVQGGDPINQLLIVVGDERAGSEAAWGHVDLLFSTVSEDWREGLRVKALPPVPKEWPAWAVQGWKRGEGSLLAWSRPEEVLARLTKPEASWSGFAPRTLLLGVRGGVPRPLRDPVPAHVLLDAANELKPSLEFGKRLIPAELGLTPEAVRLWVAMYPVLREPRNSGAMVGIMTELAERHVMRLAGICAVIDQSSQIRVEHLLAALAIWDYHEATLYELFANVTGDKKRDDVVRTLQACNSAGMTTDEVNRAVLQGNRSGGAGKVLRDLEEAGMVYSRSEPASGRGKRPVHRWFPTEEALNGSQPRSYLDIAKRIAAPMEGGDHAA